MTAVFVAADQKVTERDNMVLLEVTVDADPPADSDWRINQLAPVKVEMGQAFALRVIWRGSPAGG